MKSKNGRTYLPEALVEAAALYENAKVNVNHPQGHPSAPRDYRDRLGEIRDVALQPGDGLFGDLHFNPKHPVAEQLVWDAMYAPQNVGFSHNVEARTARRGDEIVVEAITRVQSVDLVADPATTRGLFECRSEKKAGSLTDLLEDLQVEIARLSDQFARHAAQHRVAEERKPVSRERNSTSAATPTPANAKAFVEAIT
jgi:hypothetical protein